MKKANKLVSAVLSALLAVSAVSVPLTANASSKELCTKYYQTNPSGKLGVANKTITIDGSATDWSEDMLIAQGAAWDIANNWKGGHENCVLDTYALFAAYDSSNLYVGWQMVNTTDTWAREGDGPLSDGGRVLDVPLILALSVDPSKPSMSNKNTSGGSIWGKKMGLTFQQHVDHLFYMSGKPGLGEPSMFTGVDAQGNTNYTTGCLGFAKGGIEYKMAETNICSHIWGLEGSKSPSDIYSEASNWVDFKTKKHNTKYDSFYEMKIPFKALGIDANYIKNNGIGAMLVATRGESGLDCIPYDDTMVDNATGSYSSDPSTSKEKEDEDVITSPLARIGKGGGGTPIIVDPTDPVVDPTDPVVDPTDPVIDPGETTTTISAKSNVLGNASVTSSTGSGRVTVKYQLKSGLPVANAQWNLSYDTSKLRLVSSTDKMTPNLSGDYTNTYNNRIYGAFSDPAGASFTGQKTFVQAEFEVIGTGTANVNLTVNELSVGTGSGSNYQIAQAVADGQKQTLTGSFASGNISGSAQAVLGSAMEDETTGDDPVETKTLTVNATSNFFAKGSAVISETASTVTVEYLLKSNLPVLNSDWVLTYDTTKLSFNKSATGKMMPNVPTVASNEPTPGRIKGSYSNTSTDDFSTEKTFVKAVFDKKGTGTADVYLDVQVLGLTNDNDDNGYLVDKSKVQNLSSQAGFTNLSYTAKTRVTSDGGSAPDVKMTLNSTSNYFPTAKRSISSASNSVTLVYKLSSTYELFNAEWVLTYDTSKLRFNQSNLTKMMPNVKAAVARESNVGTIKGNFANLSGEDFSVEDDFIVVPFDVIGSGETTVNLEMKILGCYNEDGDEGYIVDSGKDTGLNKKSGFTKLSTSKMPMFIPGSTADYVKGDVNFDGKLTVADATYIQQYAAELVNFRTEQKNIGDINSDRQCTVADASRIQNVIAEIV